MSTDPAPQDLARYPLWTVEKLREVDTDHHGHIRQCRHRQLLRRRPDRGSDRPRSASSAAATSVVVVRWSIDFRKELFFAGSVRIGSRISQVGNGSFQFEQVLRYGQADVAHAKATCELIDPATRRPVPEALRCFLLDPPPANAVGSAAQ